MSARCLMGMALCLLVLGTAGPLPRAESGYTFTDLGTLGGPSVAMGINASGQVVGFSYTTPDALGDYHAFLYSGGTMTDLSAGETDAYSDAVAINASGQIVGTYYDAVAYRYDPANTTNPWLFVSDPNNPPANYYAANAINDSGTFVGYGISSAGTNPFAYWSDGTQVSKFSIAGTNYVMANGINAGGRIVGAYTSTDRSMAF
jgi:probable HAF family extracellular repeat protein